MSWRPHIVGDQLEYFGIRHARKVKVAVLAKPTDRLYVANGIGVSHGDRIVKEAVLICDGVAENDGHAGFDGSLEYQVH